MSAYIQYDDIVLISSNIDDDLSMLFRPRVIQIFISFSNIQTLPAHVSQIPERRFQSILKA